MTVPPGAQVTLTFEDGQAHGSAACNSYGGAYRAGDDGSLSFDAFAVTQMACDPPLMTLETAYLEVLGGVSAFEVGSSGDLSLSNGDATLTFARQVTPEPLPLVGTTWTLSSISSGDAVTSVISGTEITARVLGRQHGERIGRVQRFQRPVHNGRRLVVVLAPRHDEDGMQEVRHGAGTACSSTR